MGAVTATISQGAPSCSDMWVGVCLCRSLGWRCLPRCRLVTRLHLLYLGIGCAGPLAEHINSCLHDATHHVSHYAVYGTVHVQHTGMLCCGGARGPGSTMVKCMANDCCRGVACCAMLCCAACCSVCPLSVQLLSCLWCFPCCSV